MNDGEGEGWGRSERGRLELMQLNGDVVEGEKGGRKEIEVCVRVCVCRGGREVEFFFFYFCRQQHYVRGMSAGRRETANTC